jgi:hypothetical protein
VLNVSIFITADDKDRSMFIFIAKDPAPLPDVAINEVQWYEADGAEGVIVAADRETADQYVALYKREQGILLSIEDIGPVDGEEYEEMMEASREVGKPCCVFVVKAIHDDLIDFLVVKE